jgi:hypothetical protein
VINSLNHLKLCWLVSKRAMAISVVAVGAALPAPAFDGSAPFGLAWGPLDKIPKPSLAFRDANVTVLAYRRERLPSNDMPDTEVVLIDVCKKEGLQQVSWASKALSSEEATAKLVQMIALGVQKYGEGKPTSGGAFGWENGRIEILRVSGSGEENRILMVSRGPDFEACAAVHDQASDQSLATRWLRRIDLPN